MKINYYVFFIIFLSWFCFQQAAPEHCGLFEPYQWLFDPVRLGILPSYIQKGIVMNVRVEFSGHLNGLLSYDKSCRYSMEDEYHHKVNPLMYLQERENMYASFLGHTSDSEYGSFVQQYNLYNGLTSNQLALLEGKVSYGNVVASLEYWVGETLRLGWYLPFYWISLKNTRWNYSDQDFFFEQTLSIPFVDTINRTNDLNTGDFNRNGIGDSSLLISWQDVFKEKRDFVTAVTCAARAGLHLPTKTSSGVSDAENSLLRMRMGYDAAWGVICGGSLGLDIGSYATCGVTADFTKFFGKLINRRIKTDMRETDLLLLTERVCFIDPGFKQEFMLYADAHTFSRSLTLTGAYTYSKQHDSELVLSSAYYSQAVAATMQRLRPWSIHAFTMQLQGYRELESGQELTAGSFVKYGFRGERSIAGLTGGFSFSCTF